MIREFLFRNLGHFSLQSSLPPKLARFYSDFKFKDAQIKKKFLINYVTFQNSNFSLKL